MRVKEFMELYSDSNFHFMTSKGYLFLNSDQVKSILLEGQKEAAKKELGKGIRADELLAGEVISVSWKKGICHMTAELHRDRQEWVRENVRGSIVRLMHRKIEMVH